ERDLLVPAEAFERVEGILVSAPPKRLAGRREGAGLVRGREPDALLAEIHRQNARHERRLTRGKEAAMTKRSGVVSWTVSLGSLVVLLVGIGAALARASAPPPAPPSAAPTATCVFSNPGFSGKCTQSAPIPAGSNEQKTCESILQCLNDTRCLKNYCGTTELRTGWKLESAKAASPPPR